MIDAPLASDIMRPQRGIIQAGPDPSLSRAGQSSPAGLSCRSGRLQNCVPKSDLTGQRLTFRLIFRDSCKRGVPPASVRSVSEVEQTELVTSRVSGGSPTVTPIMERRWTAHRGLLEPPWTLQQFHDARDYSHSGGRPRGSGAAYDMETRWTQGCSCARRRRVGTSADDLIGRAGAVAAATESDIPESGASFT